MPLIPSHIRWLKYQGKGSITASPGAQAVATATQKAWLQPAVIATCSGAMPAP